MNTETIAEVLENFPNASGFITNLLYANPRIPIEHKIAQGAPKKRKYVCLIESLKIGDDVVTESGIFGRIVNIKDESITLVLKKGEIEILKSKILHN